VITPVQREIRVKGEMNLEARHHHPWHLMMVKLSNTNLAVGKIRKAKNRRKSLGKEL
jgi:hypothetical protein